MYVEEESIFYYLTVENEVYPMPAMPEGAREGILKGIYRFCAAERSNMMSCAQLLASGAILREAIKAQALLAGYGVAADVWSVTSWSQLYRDGHACDRWNMLHPLETPQVPYVTQCLKAEPGVVVAASDYMKVLPYSLSQWLDTPLVALGTDPFFIFYSMFGFQRVGDLIWAAADSRCRGFLLGGTAGRTTLAGEGLQHQDGQSHVLARPYQTSWPMTRRLPTKLPSSSRTVSVGCMSRRRASSTI